MQNLYPKIELLAGSEKRFLQGYPWVYANELLQNNETKSLPPGEIVSLTLRGRPLAIGYYNRHSLIAFRVLSRDPSISIDTEFFKTVLQNALNLRSTFFKEPYYRLIHAEADGMPGLIIDRFGAIFVLQMNTQGMENLRVPLLAALNELFDPCTLYIKNDTKTRTLEGLELKEPEIIGVLPQKLEIIENDLHYFISLTESPKSGQENSPKGGQKTGWFYDHRENRKLIAELSKDKSVIDYYCYGGGFGILAAHRGAKRVVGIDRSKEAILDAQNTALANNLEKICSFECREVFEDMEERIQRQERFDRVLLDPPAFVKVKKDLASGLKGYEKLIKLGLQLTAPEGFLSIASCSYHVTETDLQNCLSRALAKQNRRGRILKKLQPGPDHPIQPWLPESAYLKGFLLALD